MHFSTPLKSSSHCMPSPDGTLIATLLPSSITVRAIASFDVVRTVKLPSDLAGGVTSLTWSPSSSRILVAAADQLHFFSAKDGGFHGAVRFPSSLASKPTHVECGATDNEACVWSPLGLKLTIVNLASSKAVEISNPKLYNAASAHKGYSFRPRTHHLALLTRTDGKDMVSIHCPETREIQRSWQPNTIDAQGLAWTPEGRWLVVWETAAQDYRVIFYTSDGHVFKDWRGPLVHAPEDMGLEYGAGVKTLAFSPNGRHTAIASGSRCIFMLNGQSMVDEMSLRHPQTVKPKDTLQVWQEHIKLSTAGALPTTFVRATQAVSPPAASSNNMQDVRSGCNLAKFDSSSTLLATRLEEAPSTIWIWDVPTAELRAVIMYHSSVSKVEWHPDQPELLLMRCEGDNYGGVLFVWDPLSGGPRSIDFARHWPGKTDDALPWRQQSEPPADAVATADDAEDDSSIDMDEGMSELDDTFQFKK
ncbi:Uu.00g002900.m01.CDS01 [Anthostomella pinea]|uniref:Uu.00g002900.m01.CDS01 n=1 Tax=Anthostomella pinea TaxID=933095 RepID=A0AAI8VKT2_9PEZI|nr:Uu.00g002900.m01.CDS01 [Anthostomella pinea]